jgi:hypothetical protein
MEMAGDILKPIENGTTFEFKFSHMVSLFSLALPCFCLFFPPLPFPDRPKQCPNACNGHGRDQHTLLSMLGRREGRMRGTLG